MPGSTFGSCWREVRLHVPDAPFGLVRSWTQSAYEALCERRPWVWTRKQGQLQVPASRSITCVVTLNSLTVTSAGLFLSTDVGLQFRVGSGAYYTIMAFASTSSVTVDQPYTGTTGSTTATLSGTYQILPADFGAFILVADPSIQRQVAWWYTQDDLGLVDPSRTIQTSVPRALISTTPSPVPATLGQPRSEWWPSPSTARVYPYFYRQAPQALADTDLLQGVLATRNGVLVTGALMECALWPGTSERKNPYFSNVTYRQFKDKFEQECAHLELRDDDQSQQSWQALPYHHWAAWSLGGDTHYLRESDASVYDYR